MKLTTDHTLDTSFSQPLNLILEMTADCPEDSKPLKVSVEHLLVHRVLSPNMNKLRKGNRSLETIVQEIYSE